MSPFLVIQTVFFSELSLGLTINKNNLMKKSVHVEGLTSISVNECFLEGSNAIVTPCLSNHFNPFTAKISFTNSLNCLLYNRYDVSLKNLVLDQLVIP